MAQISYGSITIVDTTDIEQMYVEYAKNSNSASAPNLGWSTSTPTWENGKFIWQRTVIKKQGIDTLEYGNPVCLTGAKGDTGQTGDTGIGISSIDTYYCNYGTGTPTNGYSGWSSSVPAYDNTKPNYWVKTVITYDNNTTDVSVYKDLGITEAVEKANLATVVANTANQNSV
jgi:hypothetical protein